MTEPTHTAENDAPTEGRYVIEVWNANIGPGELLAVVSDALTARGTEHGRVRVSYSQEEHIERIKAARLRAGESR